MVSGDVCGTAMLAAAIAGAGAMNYVIADEMDVDADGNVDQCSDAYFAENYGYMGIFSAADFCAASYEPSKADPYLVHGTISEVSFDAIPTTMSRRC